MIALPSHLRTTPAKESVDALATARVINLVTYRRTGIPVGTPVLFVPDGDRLLVRVAHDAGKLKRLRHTAAVEVARSDSRGRRLGPSIHGRARILETDAVDPALRALHARYRIAGQLFTWLRHLRGKRDVIVEIVLDPSSPS
jgi:PPOX class probable F420-dependent enzyme